MLSDREAFKTGFLARCVEAGLDRNQILTAVKSANDKVAGLLDLPIDAAKGLFHFGTGTLLPAAMIAPPILGGLAGYGLSKATDINDDDVNDVKDREVLNAYRTEAEKLRRQRLLRTSQAARAPARRHYM